MFDSGPAPQTRESNGTALLERYPEATDSSYQEPITEFSRHADPKGDPANMVGLVARPVEYSKLCHPTTDDNLPVLVLAQCRVRSLVLSIPPLRDQLPPPTVWRVATTLMGTTPVTRQGAGLPRERAPRPRSGGHPFPSELPTSRCSWESLLAPRAIRSACSGSTPSPSRTTAPPVRLVGCGASPNVGTLATSQGHRPTEPRPSRCSTAQWTVWFRRLRRAVGWLPAVCPVFIELLAERKSEKQSV